MTASAPTVFIVDDDAPLCRALARLLREHGWPTAAYASAEDFLAQRDAQTPGCLVLDVSLPGLDGLALQRRLAPDFDDRGENPGLPTDYPVPQRLLDLQRAVLNQLMSDAVAARILDSVGKSDRPEAAFQLSELYQRLNRDIWGELAAGGNISATRRELQRDHVNRVANSLFHPNPQARADARSLLRVQAVQLQAQLDKALKRRTPMDAASRAHLQDSADTLSQALSARLYRAGV